MTAKPRHRAARTQITRTFRRHRWQGLEVLIVTVASVLLLSITPANASAKAPLPAVAKAPGVENWTGPSTIFHPFTATTRMTIAQTPGAVDGKALKLQLGAYPQGGAAGASVIASNKLYRFGSFGARMKTADCTGQDHVGVVTGVFTYGADHSDANHNGMSDNDEIDVEFLCAQPDVIYLTIWTDYNETGNSMGEITRAINLRAGTVLSTCYLVAYETPCRPLLAGENTPSGVPAIAGFNSATQFATYSFDWQADHVTFTAVDRAGRTLLLWDYRGPKSRIPNKPSALMQNVTYTKGWDPLNGPAHNQPTADTSAYIDTTFALNSLPTLNIGRPQLRTSGSGSPLGRPADR